MRRRASGSSASRKPWHGAPELGGEKSARLGDGRRGHRHGRRERTFTTSLGPTSIGMPRARIRQTNGTTTEWRSRTVRRYQRRTTRVDAEGQRQRFTSQILPNYMRKAPKVTEVLPILHLRGLSTGDFQAALPVLLGEDATGLSPTTITRLTAS
jgi:hypothetical protein